MNPKNLSGDSFTQPMRFFKFLSFLSLKDTILFTIGTMIVKSQLRSYIRLNDYRSFVTCIDKLNFNHSITNKFISISNKQFEFSLRRNSSDLAVFDQIFIIEEYKPVIDYLIINKITINTVIDAGSNIGLTTIKLLSNFPDAQFFCIEPDPQNFVQLARNLKDFPNVTLINKALWFTEEILSLNFEFRDGQAWARSVTQKKSLADAPISGVSLNTLIDDYSIESIDFLKIDIEGSEATIFNQNNDLSFLARVKVIAIEIHDEFNCRDDIYRILKLHNFKLFNSGELTVAIRC